MINFSITPQLKFPWIDALLDQPSNPYGVSSIPTALLICSFMPFYHVSNTPTLMHKEKTLRVGIFARTNVEGILPINIYFTNTIDFYSYLFFSTIITHNALRTKGKRA
jgi:hypothetical protein